MADFSYIAIEKSGREVRGSMEADSRERVDTRLRGQGLIPLEIQEQNAFQKDIRFGKKVKTKDLSIFCRQFVSMLRAGVSIMDALEMLSVQTENKTLAKAIAGTRTEIGKGTTLSEAMAMQGEVFPVMLINMIEAGENSGSIDQSLERMAVQFEKSTKLKGLIKKSMIYPAVLLAVTFVIFIVVVTYVIPKYMEMFEGSDLEMPLITRALMGLSNFIINHAVLLIVAIVAVVLLIVQWKKTESGKIFFGKMALRIPVFKKLNVKTYCSNFARTLSTLMLAGIPMIDAVDNVAKTMTNILYRNELLRAKEEVAKGIPLSEPLKVGGMFPPMVIHMMSIGEETGEIEEMLDRLADYYDEEVEMTTQSVIALLEPMIIIIMTIIVLILIAAIMGPMMMVYNNAGSM
ncbi:MAG: type II secretion system F family protein [Lachnospiraceae bacterium]